MATKTLIRLPKPSFDQATRISPRLLRRSPANNVKPPAEVEAINHVCRTEQESTVGLKSTHAIEPQTNSDRFGFNDCVSLVCLLTMAAAATTCISAIAIQIFQELVRHSAADLMRMLAGMP